MTSTLERRIPNYSPTDVVLELGAGLNPVPFANQTLDIRDDLEHIDYPGVDIGEDEWPVAGASVDVIIAYDVLEHVRPESIGHVWEEADRVLRPGGRLIAHLPHAGTWAAMTDPTHQGTGGTTPSIDSKWDDGPHGYWSHLNWDVRAYAEVKFPSVCPSWAQVSVSVDSGHLTAELVKIPFVTAYVWIEATKRE